MLSNMGSSGSSGDDSSDMSDVIGGANQKYQEALFLAMNRLSGGEDEARGDISDYYRKGLAFGAPYRAAGTQALQAYQGTLGLGGAGGRASALESFRASPGYQYALQQGLQGVQRGEAAHGLRGSGAEQRALLRESQGLASQDYGQYQQRLAGLAGMGAGAAQQGAQAAYGAGRGLASVVGQFAPQEAALWERGGQASAEAEMAAARVQQAEDAQQSQMIGQGMGIVAAAF